MQHSTGFWRWQGQGIFDNDRGNLLFKTLSLVRDLSYVVLFDDFAGINDLYTNKPLVPESTGSNLVTYWRYQSSTLLNQNQVVSIRSVIRPRDNDYIEERDPCSNQRFQQSAVLGIYEKVLYK